MFNQKLVDYIICNCESFKIGKTSMALGERRKEPDYRDLYPNIDSVYDTNNYSLASKAESDLIDAYINHPKCDNIKDGDQSLNDHMGDGDIFRVYIVWR